MAFIDPIDLVNALGQLRLSELNRIADMSSANARVFLGDGECLSSAGLGDVYNPSINAVAASASIAQQTASAVDADGYWTCILVDWDPAGPAWTTGDTISVKDANGAMSSSTNGDYFVVVPQEGNAPTSGNAVWAVAHLQQSAIGTQNTTAASGSGTWAFTLQTVSTNSSSTSYSPGIVVDVADPGGRLSSSTSGSYAELVPQNQPSAYGRPLFAVAGLVSAANPSQGVYVQDSGHTTTTGNYNTLLVHSNDGLDMVFSLNTCQLQIIAADIGQPLGGVTDTAQSFGGAKKFFNSNASGSYVKIDGFTPEIDIVDGNSGNTFTQLLLGSIQLNNHTGGILGLDLAGVTGTAAEISFDAEATIFGVTITGGAQLCVSAAGGTAGYAVVQSGTTYHGVSLQQFVALTTGGVSVTLTVRGGIIIT